MLLFYNEIFFFHFAWLNEEKGHQFNQNFLGFFLKSCWFHLSVD